MNKKTIGILIILVSGIVFGMFYCNSIILDEVDEDVFVGEPPELISIYPNLDSDGIIYIMWNPVENATSYDLYRNVNGNKYELIAQVRAIPSLTGIFRDYILVSGEYGYKVKAIHTDGESDFSNPEFVTVIIPNDLWRIDKNQIFLK